VLGIFPLAGFESSCLDTEDEGVDIDRALPLEAAGMGFDWTGEGEIFEGSEPDAGRDNTDMLAFCPFVDEEGMERS
jgi:hypothetical protein